MPKIIPEKMVEIWTANALVTAFGQSVNIWSPTHGADQGGVTPVNGKRFWLELKSPEWISDERNWWTMPQPAPKPSAASSNEFKIDIGQLLEYSDGYQKHKKKQECGPHSDVIYVFPVPSQCSQSSMLLQGRHVRKSFPKWAYTIRASRLVHILEQYVKQQASLTKPLQDFKNRLKSQKTSVRHERRKPPVLVYLELQNKSLFVSPLEKKKRRQGQTAPSVRAERLDKLLRHLKTCEEPYGLSCRSKGLKCSTKRTADAAQGLQDIDLPMQDPNDEGDDHPDADGDQQSETRVMSAHLMGVEIPATYFGTQQNQA